jgi:hypothetical protein
MFEQFYIESRKFRGFLKVKAASCLCMSGFVVGIYLSYAKLHHAGKAGNFTCLFFRCNNAELKMPLHLSLVYNIGAGINTAEILSM